MDGHSNTHIYCTGKLLSKIHLSCIVRKTGAPPMPIEEEYAKPTHKGLKLEINLRTFLL